MIYKEKYVEYMNIAIEKAKKAYKLGEIPVGAVIVQNNKIIGSGFNQREKKNNALAHAEILAINSACKKLKSWRLLNSAIFVTLEPCIMCAGAILNAKIEKIVFGTKSYEKTIFGSLNETNKFLYYNKLEIISGVCEKECRKIIQKFFKNLR